MKLSELFTELKIEGFGQYIADMERAKRAGQDFTQTWVNSQLRAGEAVKANIEALRRVTAGGMGRDIQSLEHPGAITSRAFVSRVNAATEALRQFQIVEQRSAVTRLGAGSGVTAATEALRQFQIVEQRGAVTRLGAGSGVTAAADRLRAMRQQMSVEQIMGGAFPEVQFKNLEKSIDGANTKLLRFNQSGRLVTLLFGSEMPAGATRMVSSLGLVMTALDGITNRARVMQVALRGAMIVSAGAVGYGVGRMIGDPLGRLIYKPEGTEEEQRRGREEGEASERAVAAANRENAAIQSTWDTRNRLLQLQLKSLDPLSTESEYLQEQLITRNYLVERGNAAAQAGAVGVKNAKIVYEAELSAMREAMRRGRLEKEISEEMSRRAKLWADEEAFAESVARLRKDAAEQSRKEREAAEESARRIRESAISGTIGLFPGARGEIMRERLAAEQMKNMSGTEYEAALEQFQLGRLLRRREQEQGILSAVVSGRPQPIRGGVAGLEAFAQSIQSAVATVKPDEKEWQDRVARALEALNGTEDEIRRLLEDRLYPGLQLTETGDF